MFGAPWWWRRRPRSRTSPRCRSSSAETTPSSAISSCTTVCRRCCRRSWPRAPPAVRPTQPDGPARRRDPLARRAPPSRLVSGRRRLQHAWRRRAAGRAARAVRAARTAVAVHRRRARPELVRKHGRGTVLGDGALPRARYGRVAREGLLGGRCRDGFPRGRDRPPRPHLRQHAHLLRPAPARPSAIAARRPPIQRDYAASAG